MEDSVGLREMLRTLNFLDNQLSDADEVDKSTHRPRSTPHKYFYICLWYSFMDESNYTRVTGTAGRFR